MSEFRREERYVTFKLSKLDANEFVRGKQLECLGNSFIADARVDCLVVEADWPEYEPAWQMIEARMQGSPVLDHTNSHADIHRLSEQVDSLQAELTKARELLAGVCEYANGLLTEVNDAWAYAGSTGEKQLHKDSDYLESKALLANQSAPSAKGGA